MPAPEPLVLHVTGMTCNNCVNHVQKALLSTPGVEAAVVNLKRGTAEVRGAAGLSRDRLVEAIRGVGYDVKEPGPKASAGSGWKFWKR